VGASRRVTSFSANGLTTGQVSPTGETGMVTKSTPHSNLEQILNPMALAAREDPGLHVFASAEPDERWLYCFADDAMVEY
jgi:hypothetical protein